MQNAVTDKQLKDALSAMILSASGWRKVFAPDGEHGASPLPADVDLLLGLGMGIAWGQWLKARGPGRGGDSEGTGDYGSLDSAGGKSTSSRTDNLGGAAGYGSSGLATGSASRAAVLVATDTRPTGPALAEMVMRGLESAGFDVIYVGVAAAPEAMARCAADDGITAFAYVSASHNPLGHNGVKFGLDGGVIGGDDARGLIALYRSLIEKDKAAAALASILDSDPQTAAAAGRMPDVAEKARTLIAYRNLLKTIAGGPGDEESRRVTLDALKSSLEKNPLTVVADLNGSARCLSADRSWLEGLGARLISFNDVPGSIAHTILPEGEALEPCRLALEEAHEKDPSALIGYVPDNDGDRGNLVIWDEPVNRARILEAQEVFALSVLAEFACAAWGDSGGYPGPGSGGRPAANGQPVADSRHSSDKSMRQALVVNGPTSHRVRDIAAAYGAEVFEAEVGEANVVNRAAQLRAEGYQVRLLGEGSNGGTITHPAEVRDPMNTVTALLKLLRLPARAGREAPFRDWCARIGRPEAWHERFGPADILASLPEFTTTPASAERALTAIRCTDQGALKREWEGIFRRQWSLESERLKVAYGFSDWIEVNNEGTVSRVGSGPEFRSGAQTGGLKVVFRDRGGRDMGFIWMRGSGTEPVFRVMAEIRGSRPEAEKALVNWHRAMVAEADRLACLGTGNGIVRGKDTAFCTKTDLNSETGRPGVIPSPVPRSGGRLFA